MTALATRLLHLRPVVHASPTPDGVHVRGGSTSFTMSGGASLWRVWQHLAAALTDGVAPDATDGLAANPRVQQVIATFLAQLAEHDMLVELPREWATNATPGAPPAELAGWLACVAADPAGAWATLARTRLRVTGGGPVAAAAVRALITAGVSHRFVDDAATGGVVITAGADAVAARCDDRVGFVGAPAPERDARRDAIALARRLAVGPGAAQPVLAALVGGVAAHRAICAAAGLPDPAGDQYAATATVPAAELGWPTVLVARLDPLRAAYHPWPHGPLRRDSADAVTDLRTALVAADALCDPELGLLPAPRVADLPQLPAGLAALATGADSGVWAVGPTPEAARLAAVLGAVETGLGPDAACGADRGHAAGVLLRRLALARPAEPSPLVPEADWAGAPMARRWWKALTLRFGVAAQPRVRRVADGVYRATVVAPDGRVLADSVEATPGDAAAFAGLAAVGRCQWSAAGGSPAAVGFATCGASPMPAPDSAQSPAWERGPWTWPSEAAGREAELQRHLCALLGDPHVAFLDPAPGPLAHLAAARVGP